MLAEKLVDVIESKADELAWKWYGDVKNSHYTPNIRNLSEEEALNVAKNVYKKLSYWLTPEHESEVREAYLSFGASMFNRGLRMEEVLMILVLIKRHLWLHLLEEGLMTTRLDVYQALELNNRVVLYFDRAIYFSLVGYREEKMMALGKASF
ncbi:MAG: hypothetical protein PHP64_02615 [Actinomycetota bacterium]|nr:hypothetical protein [Actinomycetota bacterium]